VDCTAALPYSKRDSMRTAWATDTDRNYERGCQTAKGQMIGNSVQLQTMIRQAGIVAPTDSSVLLLSETGTGKGCLAEMIHNMSGRRDRPFREGKLRGDSTGAS
jgi:transcriptional regulator with GAF, ATPase, and Fis domain